MSKWKEDIIYLSLLTIGGILLCFDLFFSAGHSSWMDGRVHITSIAQFYEALRDGDFPVRWADGFANYGMPIPIFAHQIPSYLGALFVFLTGDIFTAFGLVYLVGAVGTAAVLYWMLRLWFRPLSSFAGAFLCTFTSYRIFNLYVREALPEFFAAITFPPVIIAMYYLAQQKTMRSYIFLVLAVSFCALTHPMMLIVGIFLFVPFGLYFIATSQKKITTVVLYTTAGLWGLAIAAYYLVPLKVEIKYFYYGLTINHLTPHFLSLQNYIDPAWYYYLKDDIVNRGHFVTFGTVETLLLVVGYLVLLSRMVRNPKKVPDILLPSMIAAALLVFLTLEVSRSLYVSIDALSSIQFPWRMLSALVFIPPIILAYVLDTLVPSRKRWVVYGVVALLAFVRFPELYSKNNVNFSPDRYRKTTLNLHSTNMNTVWTAETETYPVRTQKADILEGEGRIIEREERNSHRTYVVDSTTGLSMIDYTFYFPGWKVYVDGAEVPIEFQNTLYKGVITYTVPPGRHTVRVQFEQTKLRMAADIVSIIATIGLLLLGILHRFTKIGSHLRLR